MPETVEFIAYPDVGALSVRLERHDKLTSDPYTAIEKAVADTSVTFINFSNYYYTAPLYLRFSDTTMKEYKLLYDTGSAEVTIPLTSCTGCSGNKHDCTTSTTCTELVGNDRTITYYDGT